MIISRLTGGLGNQMFQYAAGASLARIHKTQLKVDISWFSETHPIKSHERYGLPGLGVDAPPATCDEINRVRGTNRTLVTRAQVVMARWFGFSEYARRHSPGGRVYYEGSFGFRPDFFAQQNDTYLHGNWQSEKFFAPIGERLREVFRPRHPLRPEILELAEGIQSQPSALVHVRRGDYVHDQRYALEIGALGADYYQRATALLRKRHPDAVLYIFSDDIDAARRELEFTGRHQFIRDVPDMQPWEILYLMSRCDHAIIANSTLSWWGAWLGEVSHRNDRLVVAPRRWFAPGSPYNGKDIVPERWTQC